MLGKHHRIVIENGECSFKDAHSRRIQSMSRSSRPMASFDPIIAGYLGDYLQTHLGCSIEVGIGPRTFSFMLLASPDRVAMENVGPLEILLGELNIRLKSAKEPEVASITKVLNNDACSLLTWMLQEVFLKKFEFAQSSERVSWTPPAPKVLDRGPSPASKQDLALARLASRLKR